MNSNDTSEFRKKTQLFYAATEIVNGIKGLRYCVEGIDNNKHLLRLEELTKKWDKAFLEYVYQGGK